jgi:predicted neutral ceramidase superfamily lipid hydrolase
MMNIRFIFLIFFYLMILAAWLIPALVALVQLRGRDLADTARALWAALIVAVPLVGSVAFWIVKPGQTITSLER